MIQLESAEDRAQQCPCHFNLYGAAEKELTKALAFLDYLENALGLEAAVYADQLACSRVNSFLRLRELSGETFGHINDRTSLR